MFFLFEQATFAKTRAEILPNVFLLHSSDFNYLTDGFPTKIRKSMLKEMVRTPLMEQYFEIKANYPDTILLFRVGDFYETFAEDAVVVSEILGIALTRRAGGMGQSIKLAGFPYHSLDIYLPKLVRAGKRVAICDQLEDSQKTKNIVKRGVTEWVTPGVSIHDHLLSQKENNFLASIHCNYPLFGVAFLDISTGEFFTTEGKNKEIDLLFNSFAPKEILLERNQRKFFMETFGTKFLIFEMEDWIFTEDTAKGRLHKQFSTQGLKGFGIHQLSNGIIAAGAILHYLDLTQHTQTHHITAIKRIEEDRHVRLDKFTIRSLELLHAMNEGGQSLLNVLDKTITPSAARMLRQWMLFPLKELIPIKERHSIVEYFFQQASVRELVEKQLSQIGDLERLISKVSLKKINPREIAQIHRSLKAVVPIKKVLSGCPVLALSKISEQLYPCTEIKERIQKELSDEPPILLHKGNVIAEGVSLELDELRRIVYSGKDYLLKIQQREILQTGIPSLKVGYNNVFGYYIEVRHAHKDKIPAGWIRKQTLVHAERYITEEIKVYEEKILGAEDKIVEIETLLFNQLVSELVQYVIPIQTNAHLISQIDCLLSFAKTALQNHYVCPTIEKEWIIDIKNGRHPVVETQLPPDESYVPNDVYLDNEQQQIIIITGPNMAGKSALLRQTALIILMTQIGSFVPAESARVGLVDKIFARVGASDNISLGESTFMVEMNEASDILNNLSDRSLIIFDELGRGTSTYDGISIAWAIVEYIHESFNGHPKILFATHYHELNEMEKSFERIKNYNVSVKEIDHKIVFLRKLEKGGSEHSFGIYVAKMAGMPKSIIKRGYAMLARLESNYKSDTTSSVRPFLKPQKNSYQMNIFQLDDPVLSQVRDEIVHMDINRLTPVEALNKLNDMQRILQSGHIYK